MLPILFPFLVVRLLQRSLFGFLQDLFAASAFALLYALFPIGPWLGGALWSLAAAYRLAIGYAAYKFHVSLSFKEFWSFLRHPKSLLDSAKAIQAPRTILFGFFLIAVSLLGFREAPWIPFWISSLALSGALLYFRPRARIPSPPRPFSFPHEICKILSPEYPALRKTFSFTGKKRFDIPLTPNEKPHIVFLFLESFRAKNVGCIGKGISASPNFDRWAKEGVLFRNFHANGLQTFRAFIAALFGIPAHLKTASLKSFCSIPMTGLPQILKEQGYHPALIQSGDLSFDNLYPFFRMHGFETILGCENIPVAKHDSNSWGIDDEEMLRYAAGWLEKQTTPAFLSLFTIANHHPWKKPAGWDFPVDERLPEPYRAYLQTFSYTDHCLAVFLDALKEKGLLGRTILFIAGDHGQELGERGEYSNMNHTLFEENLHVPLLILGPGLQGLSIDDPASFIDLPPTVLDLLNIQAVHHSLGTSLLREIPRSSYFSLQMETEQIGCLEERKKVVASQKEKLGFDLDSDPDERKNIGSRLEPLFEKATAFFDTVETLYEKKRWTPESMQEIPYQITAPQDCGDEEWLSFLHEKAASPVIDLSSARKLTDRSILGVDPRYAAEWHQLTLANSPLFTDRALEWIAERCQNLMFLNLSHCPLISDAGVAALLNRCESLHYLWLADLDELSDFAPEKKTLELYAISLFNAHNVKGSCLARLILNSPSLTSWAASLQNTSDSDLIEMSQGTKECTQMVVAQGREIHDGSLSRLLSIQPRLQIARFEEFPWIEKPDFAENKELRYLTFSDCPRLSDSCFDSIQDLPLLRLILCRCPQITEKGLRRLAHKPHFQLVLDECSGIPPDLVHSLRLNGVNIY